MYIKLKAEIKRFFMFLSGRYSATGATFQAVRYQEKRTKGGVF